MTTPRLGLALAAALLVPVGLWAAESYPDTEYTSGRAGMDKKVKGTLVIDEENVSFRDKNGAQIFAIPMKSITNVTNASERDEGSFGRKMALGIFASKTEEFLTVTSESSNGAEAIVFKCKKKMSPGMVAKIQFYMPKKKS